MKTTFLRQFPTIVQPSLYPTFKEWKHGKGGIHRPNDLSIGLYPTFKEWKPPPKTTIQCFLKKFISYL